MIPGHLLGQLAATVVLEHDEVANHCQKPARFAHTRQHHLQLGQMRAGQRLAVHRAPRFEPFPRGRERTDTRVNSVRSDKHSIESEQLGEFRLVGLELLPGRPHRGLLIRRVLEFDQTEWQAVDEQHDVGPTLVLVLHDRELVDRQPIVVGRVVKVEAQDLRSAHGAANAPILDRHAVHEHAVEGAVTGFYRRAFRPGQLAEGIV